MGRIKKVSEARKSNKRPKATQPKKLTASQRRRRERTLDAAVHLGVAVGAVLVKKYIK